MRRAATATSSTPPARDRGACSRSCARQPPTTGHRASRARSGRRCASSSTPTSAPPHDEAPAGRGSRGRSRRHRQSASGCARSRDSPPTIRARPNALAYANGWQRKLGRARRRLLAADGCSPSTCPGAPREPRDVQGHRPRADGGCSSAWFVERYLRPGGIDQAIDPMMRGSIAHVALQRFYKQLPAEIPGAERVTPENVEAAVALMHRCVAGALDSGLRIDADDLQRRELGQGLQRDLEQLVRAEAAASSTFVPRELEVSFKDYELAPGVAVGGKIDRVDVDPHSARGIVVDYKSGAAPSATQIHDEARLQIPLYLLVLRDRIGLEPMGGVYMPLGGGRRPRGMLRRATSRCPGSRRRLPRRAGVRGRDRARALVGGRPGRAHSRRRRDPRPARRRVPGLVRPLAHLPQGAPVSAEPDLSRRRHAEPPAAGGDRRPRLDLRLGRGRHGEDDRARRAVRPRGDRRRPRRRLAARDHLHRSCRRRAAGEDQGAAARARAARSGARPRRRLDLDDPRLLPPAPDARTRSPPASTRGSACSTSRRRACSGRGVQRRARRVLRRRRARPLAAARDLQGSRAPQDARQRLRHAALGGPQADPRAGVAREPRRRRRRAARRGGVGRSPTARQRHDALGRARRARSAPDDATAGATHRASRGDGPWRARRSLQRCAEGRAGARARGARLARPRAAPGAPHRLRRRLHRGKDRESALDFEDLQLRARKLLRENDAIREVEQLRFRSIMVDEFQDTNSLQTDLVDLLARGPDQGAVLRRRRVPVDLRLPPRDVRCSATGARRRRRCCR